MDSGRPQRPHWSVLADCPNGQHCQVKNNDMSDEGDPVGDIGGGGWT